VYPYNSQVAKNSKKSYQWYCSSLRDVKRVVELVDGKMLIKANELEKIKQIIDIIEQKRKERGTGKSAFTKEELSKILEIRDSMRNPIQRDKKYKTKDTFLKYGAIEMHLKIEE
ncbi:MAG: hypothetical protein QMD14_04195, partial [Candidatus Aenigmarchaeota archaeon]|nr:hypothetical protein [Candidatus Aenigmarchaeota archaeon]